MQLLLSHSKHLSVRFRDTAHFAHYETHLALPKKHATTCGTCVSCAELTQALSKTCSTPVTLETRGGLLHVAALQPDFSTAHIASLALHTDAFLDITRPFTTEQNLLIHGQWLKKAAAQQCLYGARLGKFVIEPNALVLQAENDYGTCVRVVCAQSAPEYPRPMEISYLVRGLRDASSVLSDADVSIQCHADGCLLRQGAWWIFLSRVSEVMADGLAVSAVPSISM